MVQLQSCYFCGTTGSLSTYETFPADLRRREDDSRRVVLCDRCHTKLTNVLTPIVDRLGETRSDDETSPSSTDSEPATDQSTGRQTQSEVTFAPTSDTDPDDPDRSDADSGETARSDTELDESSDVHAEGDDRDGDDDEERGATDEEATDATPPRDDLDRVYHKLLRFLQNRELPIPRTEAETIAQSAYDLTAREATEVVQRAVDREVLTERDGDLHRA